MKIYHCVDVLNLNNTEDIEASSPDVAMKKFFQKYNILEKPVRSANQTHKMKYDCRFYTETNHDIYDYRTRRSFIGFNREGYEFNASVHNEFEESKGKNLSWTECGDL